MTRIFLKLLVAMLLIASPPVLADDTAKTDSNALSLSLTFDENQYDHQWSSDSIHEFTAQGQSVTGRWSNMLTVNFYEDIHDKHGLALVAKQVLENYEQAGGIIMGVETLNESKEHAGEILMSVVFGAEDIAEIAYVKFRIESGQGTSIAYAHREYGEKIGTKINKWLNMNGKRVRQALVDFNQFPASNSFHVNDDGDRPTDFELAI